MEQFPCPNCGYHNAYALGEPKTMQDTSGAQRAEIGACARCGYAKNAAVAGAEAEEHEAMRQAESAPVQSDQMQSNQNTVSEPHPSEEAAPILQTAASAGTVTEANTVMEANLVSADAD